MLISTFAWAKAATDGYDPVKFEKRFHHADKDNNGKLSRKEAYAEFPRMPEFFDEIDTNKDGFITLKEVHNTMERRVNAAINTSKSASRYGGVDAGKESSAGCWKEHRERSGLHQRGRGAALSPHAVLRIHRERQGKGDRARRTCSRITLVPYPGQAILSNARGRQRCSSAIAFELGHQVPQPLIVRQHFCSLSRIGECSLTVTGFEIHRNECA